MEDYSYTATTLGSWGVVILSIRASIMLGNMLWMAVSYVYGWVAVVRDILSAIKKAMDQEAEEYRTTTAKKEAIYEERAAEEKAMGYDIALEAESNPDFRNILQALEKRNAPFREKKKAYVYALKLREVQEERKRRKAALEKENESAKKGAIKPGATQPGAIKPGATQPGATQPGATQPGATQPGATQPGGTQPGGTQPGGSQPGGSPKRMEPKTRDMSTVYPEVDDLPKVVVDVGSPKASQAPPDEGSEDGLSQDSPSQDSPSQEGVKKGVPALIVEFKEFLIDLCGAEDEASAGEAIKQLSRTQRRMEEIREHDKMEATRVRSACASLILEHNVLELLDGTRKTYPGVDSIAAGLIEVLALVVWG